MDQARKVGLRRSRRSMRVELRQYSRRADYRRLEALLDRPVISSNQAMLWHCLRSAACDVRVNGYGALLTTH